MSRLSRTSCSLYCQTTKRGGLLTIWLDSMYHNSYMTALSNIHKYRDCWLPHYAQHAAMTLKILLYFQLSRKPHFPSSKIFLNDSTLWTHSASPYWLFNWSMCRTLCSITTAPHWHLIIVDKALSTIIGLLPVDLMS